jgi:hypothetical protein
MDIVERLRFPGRTTDWKTAHAGAAEIERLRIKVQELEIELAAEKAFRGLPVKVLK